MVTVVPDEEQVGAAAGPFGGRLKYVPNQWVHTPEKRGLLENSETAAARVFSRARDPSDQKDSQAGA